MNYREKPATPNSPSGTTVTTMYDHMLSPPSPTQEEEKDDRLRNDLLDEICNDMGIDDSMDLDFDDFCYNGQQKNGAPGPFNPLATPHKPDSIPMDARRHSTATSSSGYATSDSLCAIAKLTQSINKESQAMCSMGEGESKRSTPDMPGPLKQEPCDVHETSTNDTDQGKAAAASRLALQRQTAARSPLQPPSLPSDMKRKRDENSTNLEAEHHPCTTSDHQAPSLAHQQSWPPSTYQQSTPASSLAAAAQR